jgi:methionyl-tRNA synthetase
MVGKKVLLLANLAPRDIKGVQSQGMILMAENAQGVLSIVTPEKETMHPGGEVK